MVLFPYVSWYNTYHNLKLLKQQKVDIIANVILQIDGTTGESETNASVLERSIRCAISLKNIGLQHGDVIILMAPNHLDLAIPLYAALYLGVTTATIDKTLYVSKYTY